MFKNWSSTMHIAVIAISLGAGVALGSWIGSNKPASFSNKASENSASSGAITASAAATSSPAASSTAITHPVAGRTTRSRSLASILKGQKSGDRTKELEQFAMNLPASEFGAALKQLRQVPESSARELALRLLIARWAEVDPEGALQFASKNRDFDYIASDVFQHFASENVQSALARAQTITDSNTRYHALRGVLSSIAEQDPAEALRLAGTFGSFPNDEPLSQMIYRQWSMADPQAAAAQASLEGNSDGWRSPVNQVLRTWAGQDPLAAIAWANSLSDDETKARDISQVIRAWSRDDLKAAADWVNTVPTGSAHDAAVAAMAYSIAGGNPAEALRWAQSIVDNDERQNVLQRLGREIVYRNPTNGPTILADAGVPANLIPPPPDPNRPRGGRRGR